MYDADVLRRLFGRPKPPPVGPQLAMPLFRSKAGTKPAAVAAAYRDLFPRSSLRIEPGEEEQVTYVSDGVTVVAQPIAARIPEEDLLHAAARSWMWPKALEAVSEHRTHAIVAGTGTEATPLALAVTRVTAAIAEAADCAGVYWGAGGQVHQVDAFVSFTRKVDEDGTLPIPLWVGTIVSGETPQGPHDLTTQGLAALGHKELEILGSKAGPMDLRTTAFDLVAYLLEKGPVLKHGDTFGPSTDVRWKISHTKSRYREGEDVIVLKVP